MAKIVRSLLRKAYAWAAATGLSSLSWSLAISVFSQACSFAMSFLLARALGRVGFGEWATLQNTVGTISGIAQVSMAITATKFTAEFGTIHPGRAANILRLCTRITLVTGLVAGGSIMAMAGSYSSTVLHAPHLAGAVRISAVSLFLLTVNGYQIGALAGLQRFRLMAILGGVGGLVMAILVTSLAWTLGLEGAVFGYTLYAALTWTMYHFALRSECRKIGIVAGGGAGLGSEVKTVVQFAFPATLAGVAAALASWWTTIIIVRQTNGYAEMAALSAASTLRSAVLFAPSIITRVTSPALTTLAGAGEMDRHREALWRSSVGTVVIAISVAVPVALGAPWLMRLFGRSFQGTAPILVVVAASAVFEALGTALNQQFVSRGRMWWNLVMVSLRGSVLVGATFAFTPTNGAYGAAWAVLLTFVVTDVFVVGFIARTDRVDAPTVAPAMR